MKDDGKQNRFPSSAQKQIKDDVFDLFRFLNKLYESNPAKRIVTTIALLVKNQSTFSKKVLSQFFIKCIYKPQKLCYNSLAKQKTNNDLKENALFL